MLEIVEGPLIFDGKYVTVTVEEPVVERVYTLVGPNQSRKLVLANNAHTPVSPSRKNLIVSVIKRDSLLRQ